MCGINEILDKIINNEDLSEAEKYKLLNSETIDPTIINYLKEKLQNLYFYYNNKFWGDLFTLMLSNKLEGWCWQTTESAIVFFNDDDYIERGILYLDKKTPIYEHTWICFNYQNTKYIFDPALNLLCKEESYKKIFKAIIRGKVSAKEVKDELIRQLLETKTNNKSQAYLSYENFLKQVLGNEYDQYIENKKGKVAVHAPEDINTPLYRNDAEYDITMKDNEIKSLNVYYYK